jgi:hypothetical protein
LEDLLELDAPGNPAHAAAVEGCFRALGFALAEGSTVPSELLTALYEEQRDLLVQLDKHGLPKPRIAHGDAEARLQHGAFYLSALAVSAELPERGVPKHPVLHPWAEPVVDARFEAVLDCVCDWLRSLRGEEEARWRQLAVSLVDRLALHLSENGARTARAVFVDETGEPHELEWPSLLLRELKAGALSGAWLERLQRRPDAAANIRALCGSGAEPWQTLATRLWELWREQGSTEVPLRAWSEWSNGFWAAAPAPCLIAVLEHSAKLELAVPFAELTAEQWQHLGDTLPERAPGLLANRALWTHVPLAVAGHWLQTEAVQTHLTIALQILWQRDPGWVLEEYEANLQRSSGSLIVQLLDATPVEHGRALIPWLKTATSRPGAAISLVDVARRLLHLQVAQRTAGFREAYTLLDELERRGRRIHG